MQEKKTKIQKKTNFLTNLIVLHESDIVNYAVTIFYKE